MIRSHVQIAVSACFALALASCGTKAAGEDHDVAHVAVTVNALGTPVATLVITVTASDIAIPPVFNLTVQNGVATGSLDLPPGPARTITAQAFESDGTLAAEGSVTVDVERGNNPPISILMVATPGHVPVNVTLGPVSIALTPARATLGVGQILQITASIKAADGQDLERQPEWATTDPRVLSVSASGLLSALGAGEASVVATYAGVAAVSVILVTEDLPFAASIDAVAFTSTAIPLGGSTTYTASLTNPTDGVFVDLTIQGWVQQGTAVRAAGGALLDGCGAGSGNLAPGACELLGWYFGASNDGYGTGTLVPGDATAVLELRTSSSVLSAFKVPITLQ